MTIRPSLNRFAIHLGSIVAAGLFAIAAAQACPRALRWPLRIAGAALAFTGVSGWSPAYALAGVTSLDGPGDRPHESSRAAWFAPVGDAK